jgi:selenocysteine-specific elongation factor
MAPNSTAAQPGRPSALVHAIIGTAGHIDHGKTALIKALTGIDTDRLKEERERGISIDLGFAHFDAGGVTAGVVDVPGHERFIRNMLAGAHGVDVVLLVVAADDGVMPQTEEHLDILHLLGVRRGVVAISKIDLVAPARRAAVREEIEILLDGTGLEGSPIVEVSAVTGEGLEALREALRGALRGYRRAVSDGCFRLPVDRAFIMQGHGLVVTGTATAGSVRAGDAVRILPSGLHARVRAVQVHGEAVEEAGQGQRVALNLGRTEAGGVRRGHVVCDPALERVTDRFDALVELRPAVRRPLPHRALVRVYLGTAEGHGRLLWLDGRADLPPKQSAYAQLVLRQPVAAFGGDRFILRADNAAATIGGGVVLQPFAPAPRHRIDPRLPALRALHAATTPLERVDALIALEPAFAIAPDALAPAANLRAEAVRALLATHPNLRGLPDAAHPEAYTTAAKWDRLRSAIGTALAAFHAAAPRQPGMEMESLRSQLAPELSPKLFRAVVELLATEGVLARADSIVRLPHHAVASASGDASILDRIAVELASAGFTPPETPQLAAGVGLPLTRIIALLDDLERAGRVVRVAPELYFAADVIDRVREIVRRHVAEHGEISAAVLRDLLNASRKFSLALLNYFDRTGFTLRVGDVRKLRRG